MSEVVVVCNETMIVSPMKEPRQVLILNSFQSYVCINQLLFICVVQLIISTD